MQFFKSTDADEQKFYQIAASTMDILEAQENAFFAEAYACFILGQVLYDTGASTISTAIPRYIFRTAFFAIFDSFVEGGSLESYMTVFRAIFGDSVSVEFEVPQPGVLYINIQGLEYITEPITGRRIVDNKYVYDDILDSNGEQILAQTTMGVKTQKDMDIIMPELTPEGIFVQTTLTFS
ncbi:hypothetical protein BdPhPhi1402_gp31 [Bdellovibrio phage phi1402]|uniref:hypothetical protein n=1 Tax=Bdellovibrio phage phi1402 TaxID=1035662 RepID=UPI000211A2DD|nr:hypothetical protein BdPhPhi1402_gp31 [Bdellovibrio phage phi1402]AEG42328.1 hypothetical protein [Bdellovibrio phage phi1402]